MTTLAVNTPLPLAAGMYGSIGIIANDIVYEGAMVGENGAGYGRPLVAGDKFLGHAVKKVDNTASGITGAAGAAGDLNIQLLTGRYRMIVPLVAAITDVGQPVYASDDAAYTMVGAGSSTGNSYVGVVTRYISATQMEVEFRPGECDEFGPNTANRILKSANYTVLLADSGKIIYVDTDTVVLTMTAIATLLSGFEVTVVNIAAAGTALIEIDPNSSEVMSGGCGVAAGSGGQKLSNTKATAKRGDYVRIAGNATGFTTISQRGTWAMA